MTATLAALGPWWVYIAAQALKALRGNPLKGRRRSL